jgi:hypothetical protein
VRGGWGRENHFRWWVFVGEVGYSPCLSCLHVPLPISSYLHPLYQALAEYIGVRQCSLHGGDGVDTILRTSEATTSASEPSPFVSPEAPAPSVSLVGMPVCVASPQRSHAPRSVESEGCTSLLLSPTHSPRALHTPGRPGSGSPAAVAERGGGSGSPSPSARTGESRATLGTAEGACPPLCLAVHLSVVCLGSIA